MNKIVKKVVFSCLLILSLAGQTTAQSTDGQYVIKKDGHFLAHVKVGENWVLQDAVTFDTTCLWYSGPQFNPASGTNHNYYFWDGENYRFLSAPFNSNGTLGLSSSVVATSILRNTDQNYFFYDWDPDPSDPISGGLARGHKYTDVTSQTECTECGGEWHAVSGGGHECWEVYWLELKQESGSSWKWELSTNASYSITTNGGRFRKVETTLHPKVMESETGGMDNLSVPSVMEWSASPLTFQGLSVTVSNYTYTYKPAYTTYVFENGTHNYFNNQDQGENLPNSVTSSENQASECTYLWEILDDEDHFLSFASGSLVSTSSATAPTLYYRTQNTLSHKLVTVQLTVTYADGAKQTQTANVLVKTECQNPSPSLSPEPVVTFEDVTVSWAATADKYKVEWKKATESGDPQNSAIVEYANSYRITGLDYGTEYQYRVTAYCSDVLLTPPSTYLSFTTLSEPSLLVYGSVFGGGRMADVGGNTKVVVVNCEEINAVYGGNDIAGTVRGDDGSQIILGSSSTLTSYGTSNGEIRIHDVYGGGNGYYTYDGHEPGVDIGTTYHTDRQFSTSVTDVGGTTSYLDSGTIPTITKTEIWVNNNYVKVDSIFGGAKNAFLTANSGNGSTITIDGGTIFAVFGGNNYGGTQGYGKHHIEVSDTKVELNATTGYGSAFGIGYLFGGGNKVYGSTTEVLINGGRCDTVFAGGNSADVYAANVTVNCGTVYSNGISDVPGGTTYTISDSYPWNGQGVYNVHTLFGGNNKASMAKVPTITLTQGSVGTVYGGGNAGDMLAQETDDGTPAHNNLVINGNAVKYGTHVVLNSSLMLVDYLYGGCQMSNVDYSTWVELKEGHVGTVYGGCNISGDVGSTRVYPDVVIDENSSQEDKLEYQAVQGGTYVVATGGTVYGDLFAGSNGYYHCNNGIVYIASSALNLGNYVGMAIPTHNETHAIISKDETAGTAVTIKGNVYAGGNMAPVGFTRDTHPGKPYPDLVGFASVRMDSGTVGTENCGSSQGNVYGGGNMASILGSNEVQVSGGTIHGALYGGNDRAGQVALMSNRVLPDSYNHASDGKTSLSGINTYLSLTGKPKINTVYGGGNGAYPDSYYASSCNPGDKPYQTKTFVDVNIDGFPNSETGGHIETIYGGGNGVTVNEGITVFLNIKGADETTPPAAYDHIGTIFGGNNKGPLSILPNIVLLNGRVNTLFGGCNEGELTGSHLVAGYSNVGSRVILGDTYDPDGEGSSYTAGPANGIVTGYVFGGCNQANVTNGTLVLVEGGNHTATLFGGCNTSGTVGGDSRVIVTDGSVGSVYGGGQGAGTQVAGNVYVTIGTVADATSATAVTTPNISGDVYGGSKQGSVNDASTDLTQVNIINGTLYGNVYGGGEGITGDDTKGQVNGRVEVNIGIDDGTDYIGNASFSPITSDKGRVFGCNNAGGSPQDDVTVNIYKTAHNQYNDYPYPDPDPVPTDPRVLLGAQATDFALQAVYGGGNLADYAPADSDNKTTVRVYGCKENTIKDVFGGSNKASAQNTCVIIDGGRIDRTFGGGNGELGPAPVVGTARTEINAGLITQVFGGSNNSGNVGNIELEITQNTSCPELILEVFNGSNQADLFGEIVTDLVADCYDATTHPNYNNYYFYGGTNLATIYGNVTLNVYGGYYHDLFGGSKGYVDPNNSANNVSANIKKYPTIAEIEAADPNAYPAGLKAYLQSHSGLEGTGGNVTLNIYGGKIVNAYGGSDVLGSIEGKITVNVLEGGGDQSITHCPLDLDNVYGAGNVTPYTPNYTIAAGESRLTPEVNIKKGTVNQNVFGGGLGATATVTANPVVTIGDLTNASHTAIVGSSPANGSPYGNVYGGGELAQVVGSTKVLVQQDNTFIHGTVYGGGKGSTSNANDGLVTKNTLVQMTGGEVQRSIYGGGELGSVGTFTELWDQTKYYDETHDILHVAGEPKNRSDRGTGLTKVLISGGKVGPTDNHGLMPDPSNPASNDDFGYVFCASKGLNAGDDYQNGKAILLAVSDSSYLEISGSAVITASVYGGSENGQVLGNTHVKIMGGQIGVGHYKDNSNVHHWDDPYNETDWTTAINKVKDGSFTDNDAASFHVCDAWPFGDEGHRYVYDYYARHYDSATQQYFYVDDDGNLVLDEHGNPISSNGGSYQAADGHSFFGHVFGGGSGYYPYAPGQWRRSAGRVCGDTYVKVTGGHILTNIYGGNEITDVFGKCHVEMTGGTLGVPRSLDSIQGRPVNCNLFGAGKGDPRTLFNQWSNVGSTEVTVGGDAVVFGSVFGGGEDGHVLGNTSTTITGSAVVGTFGSSGVDGNIFGGGRGYTGVALTAGVVCGNVTLDISDNAHVLGSVFGGGRLAAVGTYLAPEGSVNYGKLQTGDDHGNITVNVSGGTIGNLSKLDNRVYTIGDVYGGSKGTLLKDVAHNQRLGLVKNTTVNISQASGKTTNVYGSVYGGGEIASVGSFEYATEADTTSYNPAHQTEPLAVGDVYSLIEGGLAKVSISGGTIGTNDFSKGSKTTFSIYRGNVFGSCLGKAGPHFSGYSFVDTTCVHITGGTVYGSVFGGGENGHVLHNTNVKIEDGVVGIRIDTITNPVDNIIFRGNVYGGGRGIDQVTDNEKSTATYSITAGKVSGNSNVTVSGGTVYRNVYGGGSFASVGDPDENPADGNFTSGLATVSVSGGTIGTDGGKNANTFDASGEQHRNNLKENGFVFGSGRGLSGAEGSVYDSLAYVNNSVVNITGTAYVTGSVFGGGENGHVKNHTLVNVNPGGSFISENITDGDFATYNYISQNTEPYPVIGYPLCRDDLVENLAEPRIIYRGNVYGGGRGIDPKDELGNLSENAGVVYGNTEVRITGGTIRHDVYGGGSVASVGTLTYDYSHNDSVTSIHPHTGNASVFISGGIIGIDTTLSITQVMDGTTLLHNLAGVNNGQVYGGGRGQSGTLFKNLAYVDSTHVEISGGVIYGAVFGGGCNGHVKRDTYVKMTAGTIGHTLSESEKSISITQPEPVYFGNVYGGGRGIDHTNLPGTISHTAGQVYGNTRVDISGGRVHNDVYGGGSLANVGVERYDAQGNVVGITSGGYAYVNITGNAIIGTDGRNAGFVYGSGRGRAGETWSDMAYVDMTFVTIGTENGSDNPQVRGSVFGGGSNGHVEEHTDVRIYTGTIGTPLTAAEMVEADPTLGTERPRVYRGNVYGGGRGVERSGSKALSPTAGRVFGNTNVSVFGGTVYHNVYGGGSLASVGTFTIENNQHVFADTTGKATVNINGGTIGMSADVLNSLSLSTNYSGLNNGQVYGSGRGEAGAEYADFAFVKETEVNVSGGTVLGAVFGGGANGHVNTQTQVNVSGGTIGIDDINQGTFNVYRGNVYGGGRGIDLDSNHNVSPTAGKVYGNTEVNVSGGKIWHNVFGGGSLASVGTYTYNTSNNTLNFTDGTGETNVNITGGTIGENATGHNGHVFGAGRGYPNPNLVNLTVVDKTHVNIYDGATIKGSVFGSGDNGQVYTETNVIMSGGTVGTTGGEIDGNLFGSGRGVDTYTDNGNTLLTMVSGQVHGNTNVTVSGGLVKNNVYGGGYMASVVGNANVTVNGSATVGTASNTTGGKVFGAGCGVDVSYTGGTITFVPTFAKIHGNTFVNINGANVDILSNVYGGGLKGAVGGSTDVNIAYATVNNVYGAGQGVQIKPHHIPANNADVCQSTQVTMVSGTVNGSVYGGGEFGSVGIPYVSGDAPANGAVSTVSLEGGHVIGSAFAGGNLGFNEGPTFMNISGDALVDQNIFGGAYGSLDTVYVAGLHTVNMRGGTVYGNVYGGSRNANDALGFNGNYQTDETDHVCVVNISGGHAVNHVFASGYFGKAYGSVYAFIGANAIKNAPHNTFDANDPIYDADYYDNHTALIIDRDVWAGADYGDFTAGQFGAPTISGNSNIYVDGLGYDTENATPTNNSTYSENDFMILRNSIYGCGTSCDAAHDGYRHIIVNNYGKTIAASSFDPNTKDFNEPYTSTTRDLFSIQHGDSLVINNSNINLIGQGIVSSFNATEKYSIHEFNTVCVSNNSSVFINKPIEQIQKFGSYTCADVYAAIPQYIVVSYTDLDPSNSATYEKNKVRVNQGTHISVVYRTTSGGTTTTNYGELEGYFFMMTEGAERTFAFARPKQSSDSGNSIATTHDNPLDGGFVSYHITLNKFSAGTLTNNAFANVSDAPGTVPNGIQIPYENHAPASKAGEAYFRVWRYSDPNVYHTLREGVLNAIVQTGTGTSSDDFYRSEAVRITLPPSAGTGSYYKIQLSLGEACNITYGTEYVMVNAGLYENTAWMYTERNVYPSPDQFVYVSNPPFPQSITDAQANLKANPNNTFGLVAVPVSGLEDTNNKPWLICNQSAEEILKDPNTKWFNNTSNQMPEIDFYLTYSNAISGNNVWDPVVIFIEQYNALGERIDEVEIRLTITTITDISQTITTQTYALMFGNQTAPTQETYTTKILLPPYNVQGPDYSEWTLEKVEWKPNTGFDQNTMVSSSGSPTPSYVGSTEKVAMTINPSLNFDNSNGWHNNPLNIDSVDIASNKMNGGTNPITTPIPLGETDGRNPISFNAILYYDAKQQTLSENTQMGTVELTMKFTNQMGTTEPQQLTIKIEVWRKGDGDRYYIDGVNGAIAYDGTRPNAAKPNLANILYFTNFTPGDIIYIVDKITVSDIEEREWNGQTYNKLEFYRYDGGHELYKYSDNKPYSKVFDSINNPAYLGTLLDVQGKMTISSSLIDGSYNGNPYHNTCAVQSEAPLINVSDGGQLTLLGGTIYHSDLIHNYNKAPSSGTSINGGAINIESGGTVKINNYVYLENNYVEGVDGGGVYLAEGGTLLLSDLVTINNNKKVEVSDKSQVTETAQNVYLPTFNTKIKIGTQDPTDLYESLNVNSKVGVTKTAWNSSYYYMPVLYGENGEHLDNLHCKSIVFDDQGIYRTQYLESANPAVADPEHHLFFVKTWTTEVRTAPTDFAANNIDSADDLAWAISLVNGLNGQTAAPATDFTLTADIDMSANIWDVIGNTDIANDVVYSGTFEGNGHTVKGIHSQLTRTNMGMFGKTSNATISNLIVETDFENGTAINLGSLAGDMAGGTIRNIETTGILKGKTDTENIGGVIGKIESGTLHSSFAVNTIQGNTGSVVGGLVGSNGGNLYNSYSDIALHASNAATTIGGLAGVNSGTIESCYVEFQGTEPNSGFGWFTNTNNGDINYCYSPTGKTQYIVSGTAPSGHGNYGTTFDRKAIGYLYGDNAVTLVSGTTDYVHSGDIDYTHTGDYHTFDWNGLLWSMNKWVKDNPEHLNPAPTPWFRPITQNINHDLPVLAYSTHNAVAALDASPDLLTYGNLNTLLNTYNSTDADASIFLYNNATGVTNVPGAKVKVSVNEDVALLQNSSSAFTNTTVGITFDNSSRNAEDYFHNTLDYDWHLMSTPLSDAKIGATYSHKDGTGEYTPEEQVAFQTSPADISTLENSYFPNGLLTSSTVYWDFYSYYEPEYHWINLKRNKKNHFHHETIEAQYQNLPFQWDIIGGQYMHYQIQYTGYTGFAGTVPASYPHDQADNDSDDVNCVFVPGKGYMMAISQESYLNSTGTLNKGTFTIPVTAMAPNMVEGITTDKGSNLVGNPYQAYLDLEKVQAGNTFLKGFWIYDADLNVYAPYYTSASSNPVIPSQYIHPHQGFFVVVDGNEELEFDYTMAGTEKDNGGASYFRHERPHYPLVNLFVSDTLGNRDLTVVEFNRPETGGVKKIDNLRNAEFKLYSHFNNEDYGLLFTPRKTARIPVFFKTPNDGTYTLTWKTYNGTFSTMRLIDNITGTNYDMLANDHYTFEALATDYAARFYIVFTVTDIDEFEEGQEIFAYNNGDGWVVEGEGQLELIDMLGQVLYADNLSGEPTIVHFDNFAAGVYMLRLVNSNKILKAQKIVIE